MSHADERLHRLRLARTPGIGPAQFASLLQRFGEAREAVQHLLRTPDDDAPRPPGLDAIRSEIEAGERIGARWLVWGDVEFPTLLTQLQPPPPVLWALGDLSLCHRPCVALVGARNASAGGRALARQIAAELGAQGWTVVSGLARGIDAAAHEGSLETGAVAVLGGGVDDLYPPENSDLHARIAAQGCILSERPPGSQARASDFPRRNRIISGLSRGVAVIEAELRSGSLITARLAAEQGREVMAVPGAPGDPRARGPNALIRDGAALVEDARDVLAVLQDLPGLDPAPIAARPRPLKAASSGTAPPPSDGRRSDVGVPAPVQSLSETVWGLLSSAPISQDVLAREAGAPAPQVMAALMELELEGRAARLPGGQAIRV